MKSGRSWRERRARRTFACAWLAFFGIQLATGLLLDYAVPLLRFPSARGVLARLAERQCVPDVVILGSSRAQGGFNEGETKTHLERRIGPTHELNVLNAAVPAGDWLAQERVFESILATGARPRLVLVEVSPEFLNRQNFCAPINVYRLARWSDLAEYAREPTAAQASRLAGGRILPLFQYRDRLWDLAGEWHGPLSAAPMRFRPPPRLDPTTLPDPVELTPPPPPAEELRKVMDEGSRMLRDSWLRHYRVSPVSLAALKRLVRRCREAGCDVILFTPAVTSAHRSAYTPPIEGAYQEVLADTGCPHVDCRAWMADGYFYDMHHLTPEGGLAFSRAFARRVLEPYWTAAR